MPTELTGAATVKLESRVCSIGVSGCPSSRILISDRSRLRLTDFRNPLFKHETDFASDSCDPQIIAVPDSGFFVMQNQRFFAFFDLELARKESLSFDSSMQISGVSFAQRTSRLYLAGDFNQLKAISFSILESSISLLWTTKSVLDPIECLVVGRNLYAASNQTIGEWDSDDGSLLRTFETSHNSPIRSLKYDIDSDNLFATAENGTVKAFNNSGSELFSVAPKANGPIFIETSGEFFYVLLHTGLLYQYHITTFELLNIFKLSMGGPPSAIHPALDGFAIASGTSVVFFSIAPKSSSLPSIQQREPVDVVMIKGRPRLIFRGRPPSKPPPEPAPPPPVIQQAVSMDLLIEPFDMPSRPTTSLTKRKPASKPYQLTERDFHDAFFSLNVQHSDIGRPARDLLAVTRLKTPAAKSRPVKNPPARKQPVPLPSPSRFAPAPLVSVPREEPKRQPEPPPDSKKSFLAKLDGIEGTRKSPFGIAFTNGRVLPALRVSYESHIKIFRSVLVPDYLWNFFSEPKIDLSGSAEDFYDILDGQSEVSLKLLEKSECARNASFASLSPECPLRTFLASTPELSRPEIEAIQLNNRCKYATGTDEFVLDPVNDRFPTGGSRELDFVPFRALPPPGGSQGCQGTAGPSFPSLTQLISCY
jgi:hypothetical protein